MTLDSEQQRHLLLQLLAQATFPGSVVEIVFDLKKALETAAIASVPAAPDAG